MIYRRNSDRWRKTYRSKILYIGEHQIDEENLIVLRCLSLFSWLSILRVCLCLFSGARTWPAETLLWGRCGVEIHKKVNGPSVPAASPMFVCRIAEAQTAPSGPGRLNKTTVDRESRVSANSIQYHQQAIRTNNHIKGWHNALNRRASGQYGLPLYSMIWSDCHHHQACVG